MKTLERRRRMLEDIEVIEKLLKMNIKNLRVIKPLTEKEIRFLRFWKKSKDMTDLMIKIGCSRPMVYKLMSQLATKNIIEMEGYNEKDTNTSQAY